RSCVEPMVGERHNIIANEPLIKVLSCALLVCNLLSMVVLLSRSDWLQPSHHSPVWMTCSGALSLAGGYNALINIILMIINLIYAAAQPSQHGDEPLRA